MGGGEGIGWRACLNEPSLKVGESRCWGIPETFGDKSQRFSLMSDDLFSEQHAVPVPSPSGRGLAKEAAARETFTCVPPSLQY